MTTARSPLPRHCGDSYTPPCRDTIAFALPMPIPPSPSSSPSPWPRSFLFFSFQSSPPLSSSSLLLLLYRSFSLPPPYASSMAAQFRSARKGEERPASRSISLARCCRNSLLASPMSFIAALSSSRRWLTARTTSSKAASMLSAIHASQFAAAPIKSLSFFQFACHENYGDVHCPTIILLDCCAVVNMSSKPGLRSRT
jgi:hypothetical protein